MLKSLIPIMSLMTPLMDNSFELQRAEEYKQMYLAVSKNRKMSKSRRSRLKKHYQREYSFWLSMSQLDLFNT